MIKVKNLSKTYDGKRVVDEVSFEVKKGEIFGFLGPNGAGKTTTLEMIETMTEIDSGEVFIDGIDVKKYPQKIKQTIGIQMQATSFLEKITLKEQIELLAAIHKVPSDPKKLLSEVQLLEDMNKYPENLSGGQRQRFAISTALVSDPKVLFLDEPTTGLDPQARRNLWELIETINKSGVTIVLTTHYMDEAELLCDRIAIMDEGKILTINTPEQLIKELLERGFQKKQYVEQANLEDVFIDLTGKEIRE